MSPKRVIAMRKKLVRGGGTFGWTDTQVARTKVEKHDQRIDISVRISGQVLQTSLASCVVERESTTLCGGKRVGPD